MNRYRLFGLLLTSILAGGIIYSSMHQPSALISPGDLALFQKVLPQAQTVVKHSGPLPYYKVFKPNAQTGRNELEGYAFFTSEMSPGIKGYAGVINILAGVDPQGTIQALYLISHAETSTYVGNLDPLLKQFISLGPGSDLALGKDIDGITGATVTSGAVTDSVREGIRLLSWAIDQKPAASNIPAKAGFALRVPLTQVIVPLMIFLAAALGFLKRSESLRWISLGAGLIYLGFLQKTMLSSVHLANIGLLKLPRFGVTPLWYVLIGLSAATAIFWGRLYCGSVCPFASVQEIIYLAGQKLLRLKQTRPDARLDHFAKGIKYTVLVCILLASVIVGNAQPAQVEVYLTFFTQQASAPGWALLILILIVSLFHQRFWCKYLCPTGALLGLCARLSPNKIKIKNCVNCQQCARICPTSAIKIMDDKPVIDYPECIMCHKCLKNCPIDNALK